MIERRLVSRPVSTLGTLIAPNRTQVQGPPIVSGGLVGYWDAANPYSYPSTGTTWTALAGTANGTLENEPTYSADRGGTITTDGTNDVITFGNACNLANNATLCVMAKVLTMPPNTSTFGTLVFQYQASPARSNYLINMNSSAIQAGFNTSGSFQLLQSAQSNGGISANVWILFGATFEQSSTSTVIGLWTNGTRFDSATRTGNIATNSGNLTLGSVVGIEPLNCEYGAFLVYDRVLSSTEMLQNFSAFRGRFNI